jgi:hypothetical protein
LGYNGILHKDIASMGIRFYCPNGHKLNVKEFQAGRLGICPFCGARSQIPTQSTRPSSKSAGRHGAAQANAPAECDEHQGSDSSPDILPGEPPSLPGDPASGKMLGPAQPLGASPGSGQVVAPPTRPAGGTAAAVSTSTAAPAGGVNIRSAPMQKPISAPIQVAKIDPQSHQDIISRPNPMQAAASVSTAATVAGKVAASPAAPVRPAAATTPPAASEPPDPIAEAPDMIWYVRPPTGGQFGPATGELMRTWLGEGRVSADSLVWREGWRDWQEAGSVFAKLRANQIVDFLETAPVVSVAAAPAHTHRPKPKQGSDRSQIAILIGLSVLVMVLLTVLLWIWLHR